MAVNPILLKNIERSIVKTGCNEKLLFCFDKSIRTGTALSFWQFPDLQHASCLAELIASELSIDENGPWFGWAVEVRDCAGSLIHSVPVGHGEGSLVTDSALGGNRLRQLELSDSSSILLASSGQFCGRTIQLWSVGFQVRLALSKRPRIASAIVTSCRP